MSIARRVKTTLLRSAIDSGFASALARSSWRTNRLLILAYHGISLQDEHLWDPELSMEPGFLRRRFELLRESGCQVLPLAEALDRLAAKSLPPRSVVLTFDDGLYDFRARALPLLQEFGFPATVYVATYYVQFQKPVFNPMCRYLVWKARGARLRWPEVLGGEEALESAEQRENVASRIIGLAEERGLSGAAKEEWLEQLSKRLNLDYAAFSAAKIMTLMSAEDLSAAANAGVHVGLHTHRHRTPAEATLYKREIEDNRKALAQILGPQALEEAHYCYPSGVFRPEDEEVLRASGIRSAATCVAGLASAATPWLQLPRFVDTMKCPQESFVAWLTGCSELLPRRGG